MPLGSPSNGFMTPASPPWQSVQPRMTAGFACMVARSLGAWQLVHPVDLKDASLSVCVAGAGGADNDA